MDKLTVDLQPWNMKRVNLLAEASGASASDVVRTVVDAALHDLDGRTGGAVLEIIAWGIITKGMIADGRIGPGTPGTPRPGSVERVRDILHRGEA